MPGQLRARRWTLVACGLVLGVQALVLATLVAHDHHEPHRVPLVIAAPAVVAQELAAEADAAPGDAVAATWTDDPAEARADVRSGRAIAAVLVDLRRTRDVVVVDASTDADLADAVVDHVGSIERSRDRTVTVERVGSAEPGAAGRVRLYVVLCGLLGFGYAVVVSLVRGPVAATAGLGALRLAGLAATAAGGVALLQLLPGTRLPGGAWVLLAAAGYVFMMGAVTLAVEALAGLVGTAAVAAAYFVLATPLLAGTSHYLLPEPWPTVTPWTPTGAAEQALATLAYLDPGRATRPVLVVVVAAVVAVLVLVSARVLRDPPTASSTVAMSHRHWRLWVAASVLPLALVMVLAVSWVPDGVARAGELPSVASQTSCIQRRAPAPQSVGQLNRQIATLQGSPAFQGADVGADVQLQDGRFLLVFGDTVRSASYDGPSFVRNSMMLWDPACVSVVLPQSKGALIPDRRDGVGYWPMSSAVAHQPGYDLVLVSTQRVRTTGGGSFDFANLGPALAVFVVAEGETPQLVATQDLGPDDDDPSRPAWGAALTYDDGWLYAYGTANPGKTGVFGFSLRVARVRPLDVLDASAWRYWDGHRWQRRAARAAEVLPAEGGVSQTLSVFSQHGRWYALSKRDGDLGDQLVFWTAPGPTGPFTPTAPVATLASDPTTGAVTYMPLAHPLIFPEAGTMVASYSRNNTDVEKIKADPRLYRPTFLRVPLPD